MLFPPSPLMHVSLWILILFFFCLVERLDCCVGRLSYTVDNTSLTTPYSSPLTTRLNHQWMYQISVNVWNHKLFRKLLYYSNQGDSFFFGKLFQSLVLVGISETFFNDFYSCALQPEELCIQTYAAGERLNKIKFVILLLDRICIIWNCLDQVVGKLNVLF